MSQLFRDSFTAKAVSPPAEVAPATIIPILAMQNGHIASPLYQRRSVAACRLCMDDGQGGAISTSVNEKKLRSRIPLTTQGLTRGFAGLLPRVVPGETGRASAPYYPKIMGYKTDAEPRGGPLPGLLRPPIIFLSAILLGIALKYAWPRPFVSSALRLLGPLIILCAVLLFALSLREFRAAGTSVRGSERSTRIVRTGPYRFSRNPIYLSFILLVLGLSLWLNDFWLLLTLVPAVGIIAVVVIPREERFLEENFHEQYSSYKAAVRRWL